MSLIHEDSKEVLKSELELFAVPPTQTSVEQTRFVKYYPTTSLDRGGPITFTIPSSAKEYIDGRKIFLYMKTRILDESSESLKKQKSAQDATIPDASVVFPINYFGATCFKTVDLYINGTNCSANDTLYGYRAYLETLLSYGRAAKDEQLKASFFYKDESPFNDTSNNVTKTDEDQSKNFGAVERFQRSKFSTPFETYARVHTELFMQNKLLIGNVEINLRFHRADPSFALMAKLATKRYVISIDEAVLYVCHKKISDSIREAHMLTLQSKTIKYPIRKVQMKFFTRGPNRADISEANICNGTLPRRIVFGLVDSEAFSGIYQKSPFNFEHFKLSTLSLRKNGEHVPFQELHLDFSKNCSLQGYMALLEGTSHLFRDTSIDIAPFEDYKSGYALYSFLLCPDHEEGSNVHLIEQGNISLELKLAEASSKSITIVCYLEFDSICEIDHNFAVAYE